MSKTHKDQRLHRRKAWQTPAGWIEHLKRLERRQSPRVRYVNRIKGLTVKGDNNGF